MGAEGYNVESKTAAINPFLSCASFLNFVEHLFQMPKKDKYHDQVRNAIEKDGWTITHDPLYFKIGRKEVFIDLERKG